MYILEVIRVYTAKTPTKMANKKLLTTTVKSKLKIYRSQIDVINNNMGQRCSQRQQARKSTNYMNASEIIWTFIY